MIDNKETNAFQIIYRPTITNVEFRNTLMSTNYDVVHLTGHCAQKRLLNWRRQRQLDS